MGEREEDREKEREGGAAKWVRNQIPEVPVESETFIFNFRDFLCGQNKATSPISLTRFRLFDWAVAGKRRCNEVVCGKHFTRAICSLRLQLYVWFSGVSLREPVYLTSKVGRMRVLRSHCPNKDGRLNITTPANPRSCGGRCILLITNNISKAATTVLLSTALSSSVDGKVSVRLLCILEPPSCLWSHPCQIIPTVKSWQTRKEAAKMPYFPIMIPL